MSRFNDDACLGIANDPVEFGDRELLIEVKTAQIDATEQGTGFGHGSALAEDPGYELKLSNVVFIIDVIVIDGVADEIEAGHAKATFIDGVIEEGVVVCYVSDANDGIVGL